MKKEKAFNVRQTHAVPHALDDEQMQNFAIVLMPSSDRLVSEWEQQQKRHGDLLKGVGETPPQGLDEVAKFASIWQSTRASSDNGSDLSTMLNVETQVDERQSDVAYAETEESITANATVEDENLSDRVEVLEGEDVKTSLVLTHQTTGGGHVDDEAERDVSAHPPRGDDENGAKPGMVSTGGNTHYAAKRSDTPERSVSGSSLDILLDHDSDTETSSHDIETGRVLEHERGTAVGDTADREGTFVASSKEHVGREDAISWIIRRTGFIDKVSMYPLDLERDGFGVHLSNDKVLVAKKCFFLPWLQPYPKRMAFRFCASVGIAKWCHLQGKQLKISEA